MDQDVARVTRLLEDGSDANRRWKYTQSGHSGATFHLSPLELAVVNPNQDIIRLLTRHGADPYATNDLGMTAFEWAIRFEHPSNARLLWELSDRTTYRQYAGNALRLAFLGDDSKTFQWLLDEVATQGSTGELFEFFAEFSSPGRDKGLPRIKQLLELGLKPSHGALLAAVRARNLETIKLLLDNGLFVDGRDGDWPPLHYALFSYDTSIAEYLLARGADPDKLDPYGRTPAMTAVRVRFFVANRSTQQLRADFEAQVLSKLRLLASYGADLSITDSEGQSIVDYVDTAKDPDYAFSQEQLRQLMER